jgi:hypothetical protein
MSRPPRTAFLPAERRVIDELRTPLAVQRFLNALPYNTEPGGETLRSFREVIRRGSAHCLEAALFAAVVLEQHGYPPLVLSFESVDQLDHVIFVYQRNGRWGSVARSRDPGGRRPGSGTGDLRLALFAAERLEGRADADRLPAPTAPQLGRAHRSAAPEVHRVPQSVPGPETGCDVPRT